MKSFYWRKYKQNYEIDYFQNNSPFYFSTAPITKKKEKRIIAVKWGWFELTVGEKSGRVICLTGVRIRNHKRNITGIYPDHYQVVAQWMNCESN